MKTNVKELHALISLLDDPDDAVYSNIKNRILSIGEIAIPALEDAWEQHALGIDFQDRVEDMIHSIQFDRTYHALHRWANEGGKDLLQGAMLVAKYRYPELDENKVTGFIELLRKEIWIELNNDLTAYEKVRIINHVLFEVHGLSGVRNNHQAPDCSFINRVVETRKGSPVALSVIYAVIAQKLELPIYCVDLSNHFVLAYTDKSCSEAPPQRNTNLNEQALFYLNPFRKGAVFSRKAIVEFLEQVQINEHPRFYQPCGNVATIKRLLNDLISAYQKNKCRHKADELKQLLSAFPLN